MGDSEPGIQAGDDGTLCAGLAAELLRLSVVCVDTLVQQAARERRAVLPTMDVGAHAVVVHVGIATFCHAEQGVAHGRLRRHQASESQQDLLFSVHCRTAHRT